MNREQMRLTEEALYAVKYLPRRIDELELAMEDVLPQSPGSVLKMVGRPVAKTPFDTSQTEAWGIRRATCNEAIELQAKKNLNETLRQWVDCLPHSDQSFVTLTYGQELPRRRVVRELGITDRQYYRIRERVVRTAWEEIRGLNGVIEMAVI